MQWRIECSLSLNFKIFGIHADIMGLYAKGSWNIVVVSSLSALRNWWLFFLPVPKEPIRFQLEGHASHDDGHGYAHPIVWPYRLCFPHNWRPAGVSDVDDACLNEAMVGMYTTHVL